MSDYIMSFLQDLDNELVIGLFLKAFKLLFILASGWWLSSYLSRRVRTLLLKVHSDKLSANLVAMMLRYGLLVITALVVLSGLGVNISALLAAAGVFGVAVGFAAKTSVANIISGLFLTFERPFDIGDEVDVCSVNGILLDIDLFAISVRTFDNKVVRIPHEKVLGSVITNLTKLSVRRHSFNIKVDTSNDMEKVFTAIKDTVKANKYTSSEKDPLVRAVGVSGDYFEVLIGVWAPVKDLGKIKSHFLVELKEHFNAQGITLFNEAEYAIKQI